MGSSSEGWFRNQFGFLRRQFLQDGELPFTNVLDEQSVAPALDSIEFAWKDRIDTPLVTLRVFLGQVLSADHSCRAAVARLLAHRVTRGDSACSAETGAYCQARKRLPEKILLKGCPQRRPKAGKSSSRELALERASRLHV